MLEPYDLEAGGLDGRFGVPGRLAAAQRSRPEEPVGCVLSEPECRIGGTYVLPEAELAAWDEHSAELGQRRGHAGHTAEHTHHHGGVEARVRRGQSLGDPGDDLDRRRRRTGAFGRRFARDGIRLDREQALDLRRIVLNERPSPAPTSTTAPRNPASSRLRARARLDPVAAAPAAPGSARSATGRNRTATEVRSLLYLARTSKRTATVRR